MVIVPTYRVLTETELKRCDTKTLDLLCGGHYAKLTARTSRATWGLETHCRETFMISSR